MSEPVVGAVERELLDRARDRVEAQRRAYYHQLEDIAELEQRGVALATGDRVTDRLVQDLGLYDPPEATRLVNEAADLTPRWSLRGELLAPRYPHTAQVLAAGWVGPGHIAVIRKAMGRLARVETISPEDLAGCERILADAAVGLPPRMLRKVADRLLAEFDPDGAAPPEDAGRWDELRFVRRPDGSLAIKGRIRDPLDAELIVEVFDLLSAPAGPGDDRDKPARQAAALTELAQDALGAQGLATDTRHEHPHPGAGDGEGGEPPTDTETEPPDDADADPEADSEDEPEPELSLIPEPRAPQPQPQSQPQSQPQEPESAPTGEPTRGPVRAPGRAQLMITMDHRWLCRAVGHAMLDSGALANPHTVRRWACDAEIIPVVLGSRSEPLDVGRSSRTVPEAIRRALNLRDGGCAFPGCTRRPQRCHAHHVDHWVDGGPTALENLCLLCLFHHQLVHHGQWTVEMIDGLPWFTPPAWLDPQQHRRPGGQARAAV